MKIEPWQLKQAEEDVQDLIDDTLAAAMAGLIADMEYGSRHAIMEFSPEPNLAYRKVAREMAKSLKKMKLKLVKS